MKFAEILKNKRLMIIIAAGAVIMIALLISVYFYAKYSEIRNNPNMAIQNQVSDLVNKVGGIIDLPTDEVPTVVTVEDKTKLQNEPFFSNAQNGDVALIFAKAARAILYRPSINKIIEIGTFTAKATSTASSTVSNAKKPTVTIRNGTTISGLATQVAKKIILNDDIKISYIGNAVKRTYEKTLVIDISGGNTEIVSEIATSLGAAIGKLPTGESKTSSNILIIAGKDMKSI